MPILSKSNAYLLGSIAATVGYIGHTWMTKKQFYPSVVHLARSNGAMLTLYNMSFILLIMLGKALTRLFFGELRLLEVELIYERTWYAVSETLLAMTVFRDEFNRTFVALFALLLFVKIFHWLVHSRVNHIEQTTMVSYGYHVRLLTVMAILGAVDVVGVTYAVKTFYTTGPSMQLLFGFEYTVLSIGLLSHFVKYLLHAADHRRINPWENKRLYVFYLDLVSDLSKLLVYISFFFIILMFYGMPLHIVRDLYLTFRSFFKRIHQFIQYRRATANMNERYQDATVEQLERAGHTCIVCRDQMEAGAGAKRLPCGHIFHRHCLRSWLEEQPHCPTCRRNVFEDAPAPVPPTPAVGPQAPPVAGVGGGGARVNAQTTANHDNQQFDAVPEGAIPWPPTPNAMWGVGASTPAMPSSSTSPFPLFSPAPPLLPPLTDQDLEGLTEDQLREMEGRERNAVAARLKYLRRMNSVLTRMGTELSMLDGSVNESQPTTPSASDGAGPSSPVPKMEASFTSAHHDQADAHSSSPSPSSASPPHSSDATEADEMRRRRLRHFSSSTDPK